MRGELMTEINYVNLALIHDRTPRSPFIVLVPTRLTLFSVSRYFRFQFLCSTTPSARRHRRHNLISYVTSATILMDSSDPFYTTIGARLLQSTSAEEREKAVHLIDALFVGDPDGRREFTNRFFGTSLGQPSRSPALASGSTNGTDTNVDRASTPSVPRGRLSNQFKDDVTKLLSVINTSPTQQSPLLALNEKVKAFFQYGPDTAAFIFSKLQQHITETSYKRSDSDIEIEIFFNEQTDFSLAKNCSVLWKSCKMATTLVLLLASSKDPECLHAALKSQSQSLGGLPTYDYIRKTASTSLPLAFRGAKLAAVNDGQTTVLAVALVDVHILELAQRGAAEPYFSFAHVFTIGIGPEGVVIWQAWGKYGYRLDEYLKDGHARIRDWSEAEQFVRDFDKLTTQKVGLCSECQNRSLADILKGTWDAKCNRLYKKLFLIDINQICGKSKLERPVTPKFRAWVRIHVIPNVTCSDVDKFFWAAR
jgi:hypothetical protein